MAELWKQTDPIGGKSSTPLAGRRSRASREREVVGLALRQHRIVTTGDLLAFGLTDRAVRHRIARMRMHRVHHGVYAIGVEPLPREGRWMAAVRACGPDALLAHQSAGALLNVHRSSTALVHVIVPAGTRRRRAGVVVHRARELQPADRVVVDGIPCTSLARTLLDLAGVLPRSGLEKAIEQAEIQRIFDLAAVEELLARTKGRRGARVLRDGLALYTSPPMRRSVLEELMIELCDDCGIVPPIVNAGIDIGTGTPIEADFSWPQQRLIVETDGRETHGTPQAFERDRERDRRLLLAGWRTLRVTHRQLNTDRNEIAATIQALLTAP